MTVGRWFLPSRVTLGRIWRTPAVVPGDVRLGIAFLRVHQRQEVMLADRGRS